MFIKFTLKRPRAKTSALITEFQRNGIFLKLYTGQSVQCSNWSNAHQKVGINEPDHDLINLYLENWTNELKRIIRHREANRIRLDKYEIQEEINRVFKRCGPESPREGDPDEEETPVTDFVSFMSAHIKKKKGKIRSIQKLQQVRKHVICAFKLLTKSKMDLWEKLSTKQKSKTDLVPDFKLRFEEINFDFIENFRERLYNAQYTVKVNGKDVTRNYKLNYIEKQVKTLKEFLRPAIDKGYVAPFTWNSIKSETKEVDSIYTDFLEIQKLCDAKFYEPVEIHTRDNYILNCFLGMRYSDLSKLDPHCFKHKTIKGRKYVVYIGRSTKTDSKVEFALHPIAQAILEKYNFDMPKVSSNIFNKTIKLVALKADLTNLERIKEFRGRETIIRDVPKYQLMSSHTGRRSFCTNFYHEGVAIAAIMSISGHESEQEFRKYIKQKSVRLDVVAEQVFAIGGLKLSRKAA